MLHNPKNRFAVECFRTFQKSAICANNVCIVDSSKGFLVGFKKASPTLPTPQALRECFRAGFQKLFNLIVCALLSSTMYGPELYIAMHCNVYTIHCIYDVQSQQQQPGRQIFGTDFENQKSDRTKIFFERKMKRLLDAIQAPIVYFKISISGRIACLVTSPYTSLVPNGKVNNSLLGLKVVPLTSLSS